MEEFFRQGKGNWHVLLWKEDKSEAILRKLKVFFWPDFVLHTKWLPYMAGRIGCHVTFFLPSCRRLWKNHESPHLLPLWSTHHNHTKIPVRYVCLPDPLHRHDTLVEYLLILPQLQGNRTNFIQHCMEHQITVIWLVSCLWSLATGNPAYSKHYSALRVLCVQ